MRKNVNSHRNKLIAAVEQIIVEAEDMIEACVGAVNALQHEAEIVAGGHWVEGPLKRHKDLIEHHRIGVIGIELAEVLAVRRIGRIGENAGLNLDSGRDRVGPGAGGRRGDDARGGQVGRSSGPGRQYAGRDDPDLQHVRNDPAPAGRGRFASASVAAQDGRNRMPGRAAMAQPVLAAGWELRGSSRSSTAILSRSESTSTFA